MYRNPSGAERRVCSEYFLTGLSDFGPKRRRRELKLSFVCYVVVILVSTLLLKALAVEFTYLHDFWEATSTIFFRHFALNFQARISSSVLDNMYRPSAGLDISARPKKLSQLGLVLYIGLKKFC